MEKSSTSPVGDLIVGDRFEHPFQRDISWSPGPGEALDAAPAQLCQVTGIEPGVVLFRHVVNGSLWGSWAAPAHSLDRAVRAPRA